MDPFGTMKLQTPPLAETILLLSSATSAVFYGFRVRSAPCRSRMAFKAASTTLLSFLAALRGASWPLVAALALGAAGDAFLAWPGEKAFLRGLSSFLAAHILYCVVLLRMGGGVDAIRAEGWRQSVAAVAAASAPAMSLVLVPRVGPSLRLPIIVYPSAILSMVLGALTVPGKQVATGATLFALSDSILAADEFLVSKQSWHRTWMQYTVWALYYCGQLLIVTGLQ